MLSALGDDAQAAVMEGADGVYTKDWGGAWIDGWVDVVS